MLNNSVVTIVTVVLNGEDTIRKTIESVVNQTFKNKIEYIVVDGISKDNTLNIINEYKNSIDIIISEKDKGLFDAMNKAVSVASGKWIFFLNSGDFLYNNEIIEKIFKYDLIDYDVVYGNIIIDIENKRHVSIKPKNIKQLNYKMILCHQAAFVKTVLLKNNTQPFEIKYKYAADYQLFRNLFISGKKFKYINIDVSYYDTNGQSYLSPFKYQDDLLSIISNSNQFLISKLFYKCLSFIFNFKLYMKYKLLKPILGKIVH